MDIVGSRNGSGALQTALENWCDIMLLKDGWPDHDAPWWYNERASVSQWAGAIWRSRPTVERAWVLEEYAVTRLDSRSLRETQGRCDLMFELGEHKIIAEAKQVWFNDLDSADCSVVLRDSLDEAKNQVVTAPDHDGSYKRYALAFVVPVVNAQLNEDRGRLDTQLTKLVDSVHQTAPTALTAWGFPEARRIGLESPRYRGTYYPGCILVLEPS